MNNKSELEDLKYTASNIIQKKNEIMNLYNNSVKQIVLASDKCIKANGDTSTNVYSSFEEAFNKFDNEMNDLIEILINDILPKYDELYSDLSYLFNKQLMNKMSDLLNVDSNKN